MNRMRGLLSRLKSGNGLRAQLARGALGGLGATVVGIGVGFVVQVALARLLGVEQFGIYAWSLAWITSLLLFTCSGLDGLIVRKLPAHLIDRHFGLARGLLQFSAYWVVGTALLAGGILYLAARFFPDFALQGSLDTLAVSILVLPLFALGSLRQAVLRALKRVARGQLLEAAVRPLFLLAFALGLVFLFDVPRTSATVMIAQLLASVVVFAIGGYWMFKALPQEIRAESPIRESGVWLSQSLPFLAISGASAVSRQIGMLSLGMFGSAADTGIYAAMSRIADFSLMGTYAVSAIASPMIVEVLKKNDHAGLQQVMRWGTRASFGFALFAGIGIIIFGDWILAAFGKDFMGGQDVLYLLLGGQLVWAFAGLSGFLLSMSGHAGIVAAIGWFSAACNLAICIVLVPVHGAIGAAVGNGLTWFLHGAIGMYFCWRHHRLWVGLR